MGTEDSPREGQARVGYMGCPEHGWVPDKEVENGVHVPPAGQVVCGRTLVRHGATAADAEDAARRVQRNLGNARREIEAAVDRWKTQAELGVDFRAGHRAEAARLAREVRDEARAAIAAFSVGSGTLRRTEEGGSVDAGDLI